MKNAQAKKQIDDLTANLNKLHDQEWLSPDEYNDALAQLLRSRGFKPAVIGKANQSRGEASTFIEAGRDEVPVNEFIDKGLSRDNEGRSNTREVASEDVMALVAELNGLLLSELPYRDFCVAIDVALGKCGIDLYSLEGFGQTPFLIRVSAKWWIKLNPELGMWKAIQSSMSLSSQAIRALSPAQALARISADIDIIANRKFADKEEFMAACREGLKQYGGDKVATDFMVEFDRNNAEHWDEMQHP